MITNRIVLTSLFYDLRFRCLLLFQHGYYNDVYILVQYGGQCIERCRCGERSSLDCTNGKNQYELKLEVSSRDLIQFVNTTFCEQIGKKLLRKLNVYNEIYSGNSSTT